MPAAPVPLFTFEEFLDREVQSPFKHEYRRGRAEMMAGGTLNHSVIAQSTSHALQSALDDRDCIVSGGDLPVYVSQADVSTYPDLMVICGAPHYRGRRKNAVDNPIVIVEVLSPSTEDYDRNERFAVYRHLASLREYVLISQDRPRAEVFLRSDKGEWSRTEFLGLDSSVRIESLGVSLPMKDIYRRVDFQGTN